MKIKLEHFYESSNEIKNSLRLNFGAHVFIIKRWFPMLIWILYTRRQALFADIQIPSGAVGLISPMLKCLPEFKASCLAALMKEHWLLQK